MRVLAKKNKGRVIADKKLTQITISCQNPNGKLVSKGVRVSGRRLVREVAHQAFVITPVVDDKSIVGYAIEKGAVGELNRLVLGDVVKGTGRQIPRRRAPRVNREIYKVNMLPDGMYICGECNNYVESGHRCRN